MKQGINPITFVGHPPGVPENPRVVELRKRGQSPHQTGEVLEGVRSLSLGRLWIGSDTLSDTAHKFSPGSGQTNWDRTFQIVIWETADAPLAFALADENDFVRGYKDQSTNTIEFTGAERRGSPLARYVRFEFGDDEVEVTITNMDGDLLSSVAVNKSHFIGGLDHLFPNAELVVAENN